MHYSIIFVYKQNLTSKNYPERNTSTSLLGCMQKFYFNPFSDPTASGKWIKESLKDT